MANASNGRFVWYDLLTSDVKAASAFYGEVVGWKTQPFDEGGHYTMFVGGQGPLGGVMTVPDEAKKMGAPPHWMSNVQVANVDATVAQAKKAGAKIHKEASDIPKVGRFAVLADPQGASISVFSPLRPMPLQDDGKQGAFSWNELLTSDHESAFRFYSELFGWQKLHEHDMGPMGKYLIYGVGDKRLGGMFTKGKDMPMPPSWIYYIHVDDLEGAVARAKSKGGKVMNGPMDVPGGDRIAQLSDPQGAMFALHASPKK
jgi:predicted enzyme related to lactoylglutathione lyase